MAGDYVQRFNDLLTESYGASGSIQINLLEQATRLADANNDIKRGYQARKAIVEASNWSGNPVRSLVVFPWMLSQYDKNPKLDRHHGILWHYKWIACDIADVPEVHWDRIEAIWDDFANRLSAHNYSPRPIYKVKARSYAQIGRFEEAQHFIEKWRAAKIDSMSDCPACDSGVGGEIYFMINQNKKGLETIAPVISGKSRCTQEPNRSFARALLPLLALGRVDEALECHRKGYPLIWNDAVYLGHCGEHLLFLTLTGNIEWAAHIFARHYPWLHQVKSPCDEYLFRRNSKYFLERCLESPPQSKSISRMCRAVARNRIHQNKPESLEDLLNIVTTPLLELSSKYDRRNGSNWYTDRINMEAEVESFRVDIPLEDVTHLKLKRR